MAWIPAYKVFKTDWKNKEEVIKLAKSMGPGMSVIKYDCRDNYNITHTSTLNSKDVTKHGIFRIVYQT